MLHLRLLRLFEILNPVYCVTVAAMKVTLKRIN